MRRYSTHPPAHTSHFTEQSSFISCCGDTKSGVPFSVEKLSILLISSEERRRAQPKSAIFTLMFLVSSTFYGLRSLWRMPLTFRQMKARVICLNMLSLSLGLSFYDRIQSVSQPASQYSIRMTIMSSLGMYSDLYTLTRLGWSHSSMSLLSFSTCSLSLRNAFSRIFFRAKSWPCSFQALYTCPKLPSPMSSPTLVLICILIFKCMCRLLYHILCCILMVRSVREVRKSVLSFTFVSQNRVLAQFYMFLLSTSSLLILDRTFSFSLRSSQYLSFSFPWQYPFSLTLLTPSLESIYSLCLVDSLTCFSTQLSCCSRMVARLSAPSQSASCSSMRLSILSQSVMLECDLMCMQALCTSWYLAMRVRLLVLMICASILCVRSISSIFSSSSCSIREEAISLMCSSLLCLSILSSSSSPLSFMSSFIRLISSFFSCVFLLEMSLASCSSSFSLFSQCPCSILILLSSLSAWSYQFSQSLSRWCRVFWVSQSWDNLSFMCSWHLCSQCVIQRVSFLFSRVVEVWSLCLCMEVSSFLRRMISFSALAIQFLMRAMDCSLALAFRTIVLRDFFVDESSFSISETWLLQKRLALEWGSALTISYAFSSFISLQSLVRKVIWVWLFLCFLFSRSRLPSARRRRRETRLWARCFQRGFIMFIVWYCVTTTHIYNTSQLMLMIHRVDYLSRSIQRYKDIWCQCRSISYGGRLKRSCLMVRVRVTWGGGRRCGRRLT